MSLPSLLNDGWGGFLFYNAADANFVHYTSIARILHQSLSVSLIARKINIRKSCVTSSQAVPQSTPQMFV